MDLSQSFIRIQNLVHSANKRYGPLASTHEGLGVALEEWDELKEAVRENDHEKIRNECLDLAAVLVRIAEDISHNKQTKNRSTK